MEFEPVDYQRNHALCMQFRKDAYQISYGSTEGFDESDVQAWFLTIKVEPSAGFYHVFQNGEIIGQIEFRNEVEDEEGKYFGYINLLYLVEKYRNKGLGEQLVEFAFEQFRAKGCEYAMLRYLPQNKQGRAFYAKHHWCNVGDVDKNGQLAKKWI